MEEWFAKLKQHIDVVLGADATRTEKWYLNFVKGCVLTELAHLNQEPPDDQG